MEKKLTDEEIVKALKVVGKETLAFAYDKEQRQFKYVTAKEILDLIHRLQEENKDLKEERENMQAEIFGLEEERLQAVKKTVNDVGKEIYKRVTDNLKMWLRERYDVEVE